MTLYRENFIDFPLKKQPYKIRTLNQPTVLLLYIDGKRSDREINKIIPYVIATTK